MKRFLPFAIKEKDGFFGIFINPDHISFIEGNVDVSGEKRVSHSVIHFTSGESVKVPYNPFVLMKALGINYQVPDNVKDEWLPETENP